jgi:hypothetical protein
VEGNVRVKVESRKKEAVEINVKIQEAEKRTKRKPPQIQEWDVYTVDRKNYQWKILPFLGVHPSKEAAQERAAKHFFQKERVVKQRPSRSAPRSLFYALKKPYGAFFYWYTGEVGDLFTTYLFPFSSLFNERRPIWS